MKRERAAKGRREDADLCRVNFDLDPVTLRSLLSLRDRIGARSKVETLRQAVFLALAAVGAREAGDRILLRRADGTVTELLVPLPAPASPRPQPRAPRAGAQPA